MWNIWINLISETLQKQGWTQSASDPSLFTKGKTVVALYVDDILASGPDDELKQLWAQLSESFQCDNLGAHADAFIGIQIIRPDKNTIILDMTDYADLIIKTYVELWGEQPIKTYLPFDFDLRKDETPTKPTEKTLLKKIQKTTPFLRFFSISYLICKEILLVFFKEYFFSPNPFSITFRRSRIFMSFTNIKKIEFHFILFFVVTSLAKRFSKCVFVKKKVEK